MKRINSPEEFKAFYPYKSPPNPEPCPKPNRYPKSYPCFCRIVEHAGGIMGDYKTVEICYPSADVDITGFEAGLRAKFK